MSKNNKPVTQIKISALEITDDEYTDGRSAVISKYDQLFAKMKPGQRIKCDGEEIGKVSNALKKYLEKNKLEGIVRAKARHTDGQGGVWWLKEAA